jgi:gamma-glutamyltranspeptidase / glutathione hydrolase
MNHQSIRRVLGLLMALATIAVYVFGGAVGCSSINKEALSAESSSGVFASGVVAADQKLASMAGAQMLAMGGNAVDAAVATSFTLSVVRPYSCGVGGGGFMVIHLPNDPTHGQVHTAINYRETAYVDKDYYQRTGKSSTTGGSAVAIPGTVSGLLFALENYGTLDRKTVLQPAIDTARDGFIVDEHYADMSQRLIKRFTENPGWDERFSFVWNFYLDRGNVALGDRVVNLAQARLLETIAENGREGFTKGPVADAIIQAITSAGGEMTHRDLDSYHPLEYQPLTAQIDGHQFICMPPPSSGGVTIIETLKILEALDYEFHETSFTNAESKERMHELVEALKHAFADRSKYLADPEFVDLPIDEILDKSIIRERAQMVNGDIHPPQYYGTANLIPEDGGTSHFSVMDAFGGAVACTETINLEFGSLTGVDEYGFVLNNEMDDFTTIPGQANTFGLIQSDRNLPAIGKRPLSSMSPTIVLDRDGKVFAIAGASGGPKIITGTLQVLLHAKAGRDALSAVEQPRVHHQWLPDVLQAEPGLFDQMQMRSEDEIWNVVVKTSVVGNVQLILRDPDGQGWQAACDPRKGGVPAGIN